MNFRFLIIIFKMYFKKEKNEREIKKEKEKECKREGKKERTKEEKYKEMGIWIKNGGLEQ